MTRTKQDTDCLFCQIVQKNIPAKIAYEDDQVLAFEDIHAQAPVHLLIIPKTHIPCLAEVQAEDQAVLTHLFSVLPRLAEAQGILKQGFRTVINSGKDGGQTVFHLHVHLMGGRSFHWPPG